MSRSTRRFQWPSGAARCGRLRWLLPRRPIVAVKQFLGNLNVGQQLRNHRRSPTGGVRRGACWPIERS